MMGHQLLFIMGGYVATRHLLELGHRRIACVTGPLLQEDSTARLCGYREALESEQPKLIVRESTDRLNEF